VTQSGCSALPVPSVCELLPCCRLTQLRLPPAPPPPTPALAQITRMLKQLCLAYRPSGGRTIAVLTQVGEVCVQQAVSFPACLLGH
jgi:hypothetical protein